MMIEKVKFEINKEEILKDIMDIREEAEKFLNTMDYIMAKLRLKRKDILVVKTDMFLKDKDKDKMEQRLKKKLHRKVLILDNTVRDIGVIER